nr:hypothetical protein [Pandoravirus massiliensis]
MYNYVHAFFKIKNSKPASLLFPFPFFAAPLLFLRAGFSLFVAGAERRVSGLCLSAACAISFVRCAFVCAAFALLPCPCSHIFPLDPCFFLFAPRGPCGFSEKRKYFSLLGGVFLKPLAIGLVLQSVWFKGRKMWVSPA